LKHKSFYDTGKDGCTDPIERHYRSIEEYVFHAPDMATTNRHYDNNRKDNGNKRATTKGSQQSNIIS
jgi:hypothetical protein